MKNKVSWLLDTLVGRVSPLSVGLREQRATLGRRSSPEGPQAHHTADLSTKPKASEEKPGNAFYDSDLKYQ